MAVHLGLSAAAPTEPWSDVERSFLLEMACEHAFALGKADIDDLLQAAQAATSTARKRVAQVASDALEKAAVRRSPARRLEAVKTLVALVPESEKLLAHWLLHHTGRSVHEVRFSILAFLSRFADRPATPLIDRLRRLVHRYLLQVRSPAADAAWMAADLLGDCWIGRRSMQCLLDAAHRGRHVAGRKAALYGLSRYIERASGARRRALLRQVEAVERQDPSRVIRAYARRIGSPLLDGLIANQHNTSL